MADRISTLDVVISAANRERDAQARHFEALDSKAGIVMGFSGVLVALAGARSWVGLAAHGAAAVAALLSLRAFLPRRHPVLDVSRLAELYAGAEINFAKLQLMETAVAMVGVFSQLTRDKARKVTAAMAALAAAVILTAGAILLPR